MQNRAKKIRIKSTCQKMEVLLLGSSHALLLNTHTLNFYCTIRTCCQTLKIGVYMLIFRPHPPHIIPNSMGPLHDLSHLIIMSDTGILHSQTHIPRGLSGSVSRVALRIGLGTTGVGMGAPEKPPPLTSSTASSSACLVALPLVSH